MPYTHIPLGRQLGYAGCLFYRHTGQEAAITPSTRRHFLGGALSLAAVPAACEVARHHGASPGALPAAQPGALAPDAAWNGTPGSGAAPPPLDTQLQGAGFFCHPTANMLEVPGTWIGHDGLDNTLVHPITIHADTSDPAGIREVRVYLEGTQAVITSVSWNPLHSNFGYVFVPHASANAAGEAQVVIDVVPVNGYIRRLGPYTLTLNTNGLIARPEAHVDPARGADAPGRGSASAPWASLQYALSQCTDGSPWHGAVIRLAPGLLVESRNPLGNTRNKNTRQVTVAPLPGHGPHDTGFTWGPPGGLAHAGAGRAWADPAARRGAGNIELAAQLVCLHALRVDLANINMWYPAGQGTHWNFHQCQLVDSNGPAGPADTNPAFAAAWQQGGLRSASAPMPGTGYWQIEQVYFRNFEGGCCYLTETDSVHYVMTGARGLRNVRHTGTFDVCFITSAPLTDPATGRRYTSGDDTWISNYEVSLPGGYPQRIARADQYTLASAVYNGRNTILTLAEDATIIGAGSPAYRGGDSANIVARGSWQPFAAWKWLTGPNIGRSSGGAGFEPQSSDEAQAYGGAHLKSQYAYNAHSRLVVADGALACVGTAAPTPMPHGLEPGAPVQLYGAVPAGLVAGRAYWVSAAGFTPTSFQICATQADALAGRASLTPGAAGAGVLGYESRCIVVNGDFSTATGHSRAGDVIRGYILAHTDPVQFGMIGHLDQPSIQNITIQNYALRGGGIGNQFLLQSACPAGGALDAKGGFANGVSLSAAAGDASFSCPPGTRLWPNDFLRVADPAHPAYGESARVADYTPETGTGTLARPFAHALAGTTCVQVKACYGMSWQNVAILNDHGWPGVMGQWQHGVAQFTIRQSTLVSMLAAAATIQTSEFWIRNDKLGKEGGSNAKLALFGCEAFLLADSILEGASAADVWPEEARLVNCRLRRPSGRGTPARLDPASHIGEVRLAGDLTASFAGPTHYLAQPSRYPFHLNAPGGAPRPHGPRAVVGAAG